MNLLAKTQAQNLRFYGVLQAWSQTGNIYKKINYNFFISTTIDAFKSNQYGTEYPARDLQLYVQPSIIYVYSPRLNFAGSYTYQRNNPLEQNYNNEHRLWQQVIVSTPFLKRNLTHRFRFEERFIENRATGKYPLSTRIRYQIGLNIPLKGKTLEPKEFYLNTYNEFYFSLTGIKNSTYSENWLYLGFGYQLNKMGRIELGALQQTFVRDTKKDLRFLNMLQISCISNFQFKKLK